MTFESLYVMTAASEAVEDLTGRAEVMIPSKIISVTSFLIESWLGQCISCSVFDELTPELDESWRCS